MKKVSDCSLVSRSPTKARRVMSEVALIIKNFN